MTITIELTPSQEARLAAEAQREGSDPAKVVERLVLDHLPALSAATGRDPMLALFAKWDEEDAGMTSAEVSEENRTWEEFKTNINPARDTAGARRAF